MNLSLISFQIILVISSPSSSTTGFLTLIFLKPVAMFRRCMISLWSTKRPTLGACREALDIPGLEAEVSVFAEARRQRKAELFISTDWRPDNSWDRPNARRMMPLCRSRLCGAVISWICVGGVTVSEAESVVEGFASSFP
jgi:hypothetical protein